MARQFDNTEKLTNLYYAIGYYRKRKGLSQEQLAEGLGVSRENANADACKIEHDISEEAFEKIVAHARKQGMLE